MPLINHAKKEINAKIVYVGPASAGKATTLHYIYSKLKQESRGAFKSMNLQDDRMLFFEFRPPAQGNLHGYSIRFHIYTLTGAMHSLSSLKMVLKGVDGVMFVADSGRERMAANLESLASLTDCLAAYGKSVNDIPCVVQYNKQDTADRYRPEEIGRLLSLGDSPSFPAAATTGKGVLDSIFALVKLVLRDVRAAGLKLEGEPEELQHITEPITTEQPSVTAARERPEAAVQPEAAPLEATTPAEEPPVPSSVAGEGPVIEIIGGGAVAEGGMVRLPLSITCGGKKKNLTLTVSLGAD